MAKRLEIATGERGAWARGRVGAWARARAWLVHPGTRLKEIPLNHLIVIVATRHCHMLNRFLRSVGECPSYNLWHDSSTIFDGI